MANNIINNLIGQLQFETTVEQDKFCSENVCAICLSHFVPMMNNSRLWVECPLCGAVTSNSHVSKTKAERIQQERQTAMRDIRGVERDRKPHRPESDVLKELGF